ncbi:MAG: hypothetical protein AAFN41_00395 [Planctomycetota bacterium]
MELLPVLAEIAGAEALREIALDVELQSELERRGLRVTEADIEAERDRLEAAIAGDDTDREAGQEIVLRVLASRSLGPQRLAALLRRNASLRMLVDDPLPPTDTSIRIGYDVRYGPKRVVRIALFPSPREAAAARQAVAERAARVGVVPAFATIAVERSTDPSARVGGLLGAISTSDPGVSDVLRREIGRLPVDTVSDIVALDAGFALLLIEEDVSSEDVGYESVRDEIAAEIAERSERLAMEALAEDLIERAEITPVDPSLRWSWQRSLDRRPN